MITLGLYGPAATFQPPGDFGRILAAYGGIFVAGSLIWDWVADGYRPDRFDITGALICLAGMGVVTYAPRGTDPRGAELSSPHDDDSTGT